MEKNKENEEINSSEKKQQSAKNFLIIFFSCFPPVSIHFAPANRKQITGSTKNTFEFIFFVFKNIFKPVVKELVVVIVPPIKVNAQQTPMDGGNGRGTHQIGLALIRRFQLCADLKI